jgi:hypothetical protein
MAHGLSLGSYAAVAASTSQPTRVTTPKPVTTTDSDQPRPVPTGVRRQTDDPGQQSQVLQGKEHFGGDVPAGVERTAESVRTHHGRNGKHRHDGGRAEQAADGTYQARPGSLRIAGALNGPSYIIGRCRTDVG